MKRAALSVIGAVALGALFAGPALGTVAGTIDQANAAGSFSIGSTNDLAQTFVPSRSGLLTSVRLWMNGTSDVWADVQSTTGGKPDGNTVGFSDLASVVNAAGWVNFSYTWPVPVNAGTTYAIVFVTNYSGGADAAWGSADTYAGGQAWQATDGSNSDWTTPSTPGLVDFAFQTFVDPQTISLGWDKTQLTAGAATSLTLTETLAFPAYNPPQFNAQPAVGLVTSATWAVTSDKLPAWFTVGSVACSAQIATSDCTVANVAPGSSMPVTPDGDPITLTLTGTASPAAAGSASGKAEACVVYPLPLVAPAPQGRAQPAIDSYTICVSSEVAIAVVAPGATPGTTLPPTTLAGSNSGSGPDSIVWLLLAAATAAGASTLLFVRRPIRTR